MQVGVIVLRWKALAFFTVLVFVVVATGSACGGTGGGQDDSEQADQQEENGGQQEELERQQQELDQQRQELEELQQELEQQEQQEQGEQQQPEEAQPAENSGADDNGAQGDDSAGVEGDASTNVYQVGDAGEVELRVEDGRLILVDIRPNQGWTIDDREVEADEVEVDFVRGNVEWEFEAELENGDIQVETERDIDD